MGNVFHESEQLIADMKMGRLPKGSIVKVQHPSGNSEAVRFHYWNGSRQNAFKAEFMMGCNMGWDNGALDSYDLSNDIVSLIEKANPKDERWQS